MEAETFHDVVRYLIVPPDRQSDPGFADLKAGETSTLVDALRLEIVTAMQGQTDGVSFNSLEDAIDNIVFRLAAMRVFDDFNSGDYDADYFSDTIGLKSVMGWFVSEQQTQSPTWALMDPTQLYSAQFVERETATPAETFAPSIGNIFPFRGECAGAFQMAIYLGLLNGLGSSKFDALAAQFGKMYVGPWKIGQTPNHATLFMNSANLADPPIPGDYMYFKNKDDYLKWAPNGFWTGLNAMYMGKDALGTGHWSGLGAAWLGEVNLRSSVANAYYHDCSPHTITDPQKECRFIMRQTISIPSSFQGSASDAAPEQAARKPISASMLASAGFAPDGDGTHSATSLRLGDLAAAIGFHPHELTQARSAPLDNPAQQVELEEGTLTLDYETPNSARDDEDAKVTAHMRLNSES